MGAWFLHAHQSQPGLPIVGACLGGKSWLTGGASFGCSPPLLLLNVDENSFTPVYNFTSVDPVSRGHPWRSCRLRLLLFIPSFLFAPFLSSSFALSISFVLLIYFGQEFVSIYPFLVIPDCPFFLFDSSSGLSCSSFGFSGCFDFFSPPFTIYMNSPLLPSCFFSQSFTFLPSCFISQVLGFLPSALINQGLNFLGCLVFFHHFSCFSASLAYFPQGVFRGT